MDRKDKADSEPRTGPLSAADICRIVAKDLKQKGYTQAKAAEIMQIDPKAVANQISGKRAFGKKAARRYALAFGYSEPFLLHGEGTLTGAGPQPKQESLGTEAVILTQQQFQELVQRINTLEESIARLKTTGISAGPAMPVTVVSSRRTHKGLTQRKASMKDEFSPVVLTESPFGKGKY